MSKDIKNAKVSDIQLTRHGCGGVDPQQQDCVDITSRNLGNCPNECEMPYADSYGGIATVPMVLADLSVEFFVSAMIDLPEPALEIKNIKKNLKITQCMLLQPSNRLFIKGFVRKNINYATLDCSNAAGVCGDIKHCTVDTPFECTTAVNFLRDPSYLETNYKDEFGYLKKESLPRDTFAEKDKLLSTDFSEYNQLSGEYFNRMPYCDLVYSNIVEFDEYINRAVPNGDVPFEERVFSQVEEKMVVKLRLKVLQKQDIVIPPVCRGNEPVEKEEEKEKEA